MESSLRYKGYLIEPLIYPHPGSRSLHDGAPRALHYQASVRVTELESLIASVSKLPARSAFLCLGDARRAAEVFGRSLIDSPLSEVLHESGHARSAMATMGEVSDAS